MTFFLRMSHINNLFGNVKALGWPDKNVEGDKKDFVNMDPDVVDGDDK